jgi:phosphopantetheine adenylyltransferase
MFKRITEVDEGPFEGFVYTNDMNDEVYIEIYDDLSGATLRDGSDYIIVSKEDFPKMLNALQSAYEYIKERT